MKLGAENPKKVIVTVAMMVFALGFFAYVVLNSSGPAAVAVGPVADQRQAVRKTSVSAGFDPSLRTELLSASESPIYRGAGRNIFRTELDPLPPPRPTCAPPGGPSLELPWCKELIVSDRPKAEIPLKFFGFASRAGEPKKVFLSHDQDVFIAREGDVVDRRYKIVHINPGSVEIQDLLEENTLPQTVGLTT